MIGGVQGAVKKQGQGFSKIRGESEIGLRKNLTINIILLSAEKDGEDETKKEPDCW